MAYLLKAEKVSNEYAPRKKGIFSAIALKSFDNVSIYVQPNLIAFLHFHKI